MKTIPSAIPSPSVFGSLAVAFALFTRISLQAQQPVFDWATKLTAGDSGCCSGIVADAEGNAILTYRGAGLTNVLTKVNALGRVVWSQRLPVGANGIAADNDGSVYVTGGTRRGLAGEPSDPFGDAGIATQGEGSAYIAKFSSSGVLQWVRLDGHTQYATGRAVTVDSDGNYYLAVNYSRGSAQFGKTQLPSTIVHEAFNVVVAKYDKGGRLKWARVGEGLDFSLSVNRIAVDRAGNVFAAGYVNDTLTFGDTVISGPTTPYLVKFSADGSLLWTRQPALAGLGGSVAIDKEGNSFLAFRLGPADVDGVGVVKYSSAGDPLWSREAQVSGGGVSVVVATDQDGNCLLAGAFGNGTISFGQTTLATSAREELYVVKYTTSGDLRWATQTVGIDPEGNGFGARIPDTRLNGIAVSPLGGLIVTGTFKGTVQFGATSLIGSGSDNFDLLLEFITYISDPVTARPTLKIAEVDSRETVTHVLTQTKRTATDRSGTNGR